MTNLLDAALAFEAAGCSVVPARPDGSKAPTGSWKAHMKRRPGPAEIRAQLDGGTFDGFGVVCGAISGNLEMLEWEGRALAEGLYAQVEHLAAAAGLGDLWQRVTTGYRELTPGAGFHLLYRVDGPVAGNTKLAQRPATDAELAADPQDKVKVLIETRGEGGFVIVAPSAGRTHPSGSAWVVVEGGPASIPTVTEAERDQLHLLARMLDQMPVVEMPDDPARAPRVRADGPLSPGDDYNDRATWQEILDPHGWARVYVHGGVTYWRRPGKSQGVSATTGRNDGDNLYVFSSSTEFEQETPYSKFGALALLEHGGDYSATARALRQAGFGGERDNVVPLHELIGAPAAVSGPLATAPEQMVTPVPDGPEARDRTSWWPRDLAAVLTGEDPEPPPALLRRDDGVPLFYPAKVNGLLGESESGKTWVALLAVLQELDAGHPVVYLDFEDTAPGIVSRLRLMGATDDHLRHLHYIGPDEALSMPAAVDLAEALDLLTPTLAVVDGVNAAMTLLGLDLSDNKDATHFSQAVLKPIARRGAAVVYVDHVPKSREQRGKGGIGAQAKRAMTTGCALACEVVTEFGRGQTGKLRLTVDKDRAGHVRAVSAEAKRAGVAVLTSAADGTVSGVVEAPDLRPAATKKTAELTRRMVAISRFLANTAGYVATQNAVVQGISGPGMGGTDDKKAALSALVDAGYVSRQDVGGKLMHRLERPYSELDDLISPVDNPDLTVDRGLTGTRPEVRGEMPTAGPDLLTPALKGSGQVGGLGGSVGDGLTETETFCRGCGQQTDGTRWCEKCE